MYDFPTVRFTKIKVTGLDNNLLPSNIYFEGHLSMLIEETQARTAITGKFQRAMDKQWKTPRFFLTELSIDIDQSGQEEYEEAMEHGEAMGDL
jgi:hypothetical protein